MGLADQGTATGANAANTANQNVVVDGAGEDTIVLSTDETDVETVNLSADTNSDVIANATNAVVTGMNGDIVIMNSELAGTNGTLTVSGTSGTIVTDAGTDTITIVSGIYDIVGYTVGAGVDAVALGEAAVGAVAGQVNVSVASYDTAAGTLAALLAADVDGVAGSEVLVANFLSVADAATLTGGSIAAATDAQEFIFIEDTNTLYFNADAATAGGLVAIFDMADTAANLLVGDITLIA
jgi:hypothetical protein